jgi:hypothetical protein
MKILLRLASALTILTIVVSLMSCGKKNNGPTIVPEPTEKEKVTAKLTAGNGIWTPSSSGITVDGTDVTTALFKDFTIKFTGTTLATTSTTPVWLRTDTWHFKDDTAKAIIRGQDNKEITVTFVTDTQIKLTLQWDKTTTEPAGGRVQSIPGTYEFILNK